VSVLDRKLLRELRHSGGMLLSIIGITTVGILCFIAMLSIYRDLRTAQRGYYARCRMADFWIDLKKVPLPELGQVAELAGVAEIDPRIQFAATIDLAGVHKPLNGQILSLPRRRREVINDVVMRRGSYFTGYRENEIIANEAFARAHGLGPGDTIHLLINNRRQEFLIVGTAMSSEFIYLIGPGSLVPDPQHFGVFYITHRYAGENFDMEGAANQIGGRVARGGNVDVILDRAERLLEPFGVAATTKRADQTSHLFVDSEITGLGVFATILPGIFLAVAALILNVLMTRLAEQQRTVVGTLKALGYSNHQIAWHFLKYGLVVGLGGGLLGCGFGYLMATGMTRLYNQFFEFPDLSTRVYPDIYLLGVAISLVCALAGSWRGTSNALRLQPAEAMRPKPPASGRRVLLERVGFLWRRLSFAWRMALRNVLRNRIRTGVGLIAAAVGASLLVVSFMSQEAMDFFIDFQYHQISRSDMELVFEDVRSEAALLEARRLPGVDYAEPILSIPCTFEHGPHEKKGAVTGLAPDARLTIPRDTGGRRLRVPEAGLLLTDKMADLLDVAAGETITIRPSKGLRRPVTAPVVRIANSYMGTAVYADWRYLSELVSEERSVTGAQLLIDPDPQVKRELYRRLKELPSLAGVSERSEIIDNLTKAIIESQTTSLGIIVGFAGIIFFGSVLNASLVSLAERQREIATLRVLGYGEWQIGFLLLRESLSVNLAGTLIGLPLGWLQYYAMAQVYDFDLLRLPIVATPWVWIATLLLAVLFALAAHAIVQWKIFRMRWLDALQVKE